MSRSTTMRPTPASTGPRHGPARPGRARLAAGTISLVALVLAGCATYGPGDLGPGRTEADVWTRLGEPSDRTALPGGGARLDFARGPFGPHTWRVVVDASGRVVSVTQLLTEARFDRIAPGATVADLREQIGLPSERRTGWRGVGEVWSYRFESPLCRWFQVWLVDGKVREANYAADPLCDDARRPDD